MAVKNRRKRSKRKKKSQAKAIAVKALGYVFKFFGFFSYYKIKFITEAFFTLFLIFIFGYFFFYGQKKIHHYTKNAYAANYQMHRGNGRIYKSILVLGPELEKIFLNAQIATGVPAPVLKAVRFRESRQGKNTGNIKFMTIPKCRNRQLNAMRDICNENGFDINQVESNGSCVVGDMQFMPTTFIQFRIDGNNDGKRNPWDPHDSIPSAANLLIHYGWRTNYFVALNRYNCGYNGCDLYKHKYAQIVSDYATNLYGWDGKPNP